MSKTGLVITTFNSESYFQDLYKTIPFDKLDTVVVVNGGEPYKEKYSNVEWIQHSTVKYPSVARNDGLRFLLKENVDHFFICEDDMLLKSPEIFDIYKTTSSVTGLQYFIYASIGWGSGQKHARTPRLRVQYSPELEISLFPNMCNEFTYSSRKLIEEIGLYDEQAKNLFDVDFAYRVSKSKYGIPFWYFPDVSNSDDLIDNNPDAVSRLDGDGQRATRLGPEYEHFRDVHGLLIQEIPQTETEEVITKLKSIKPL